MLLKSVWDWLISGLSVILKSLGFIVVVLASVTFFLASTGIMVLVILHLLGYSLPNSESD